MFEVGKIYTFKEGLASNKAVYWLILGREQSKLRLLITTIDKKGIITAKIIWIDFDLKAEKYWFRMCVELI